MEKGIILKTLSYPPRNCKCISEESNLCQDGGMKFCPRCGETKPFDHFNRNKRKKDDCQSVCRSCQNARDLDAYYNHPMRREAINKTRTKGVLGETLEWYRSLKHMKPCADCKVPYPYYIMQFDHLGDKVGNVGNLVRRSGGKELVLAEIAKCDLVCANCHCERTHRRRCLVPPAAFETATTGLESAALPLS